MARTRTRLRALAALTALLAGAPLAGCFPGGDCSDASTKAKVLVTARSWYLFAELVDFAAFDPFQTIDPAVSPQDYLDAIVAAAGAPDGGRGFSYLTTREASSQFFEEGTSLGFGVGLRFVGTTSLFVTQVFGEAQVPGGSPAARAGFARGDEILAIAPGTPPAPDAAGLDPQAHPERQMGELLAAEARDPGALAAAFGSSVAGTTRDFRLRKVDGTVVDVQATSAVYSLDPVPGAAAPIVFEVPAAESDTGAPKKVGYLVLRTFIGPAAELLRTAFAAFQAQGVTDLIVDLRYDGGGRLDVAGILVDLLTAGRPGPKFGLRHNGLHPGEDFDWPSGAEAAAIAPARVAFIVTRGSASASELVPFALVAGMGADVALVGDLTYGKPAGQYGFSGADCPTMLYLLSFQLANGAGRAEYWDGLPDAAWGGASCAAADDLTHRTGDPAEAATGAALRWIADRGCAGGPIAAATAAARRARLVAGPVAPEPSLAQRHVPGLF